MKYLQTLQDLDLKIQALDDESLEERDRLIRRRQRLLKSLDKHVSSWDTVTIARHPERPHSRDYIEALIKNFVPLRGDRCFGEDPSIISGIGSFENISVMVIAQEKGRSIEEKQRVNFGMPMPEGYRKAARLMRMAERFSLPIITFIDTPGANPGPDAEKRGQFEAISRCIETSMEVCTPIVACIIGEGGSGGAIALASADRVLMLQYAVYSVISPEGCASILWKDKAYREKAAKAQKLRAEDAKNMGLIDAIIPETPGGAHRDFSYTFGQTKKALLHHITELQKQDDHTIAQARREKFLNLLYDNK